MKLLYLFLLISFTFCLSQNYVNHSIIKNYKYSYATVYTDKLTTNQIQKIINRNIINGWQVYITANGYITMFRQNNNYQPYALPHHIKGSILKNNKRKKNNF